MSESRAIPALHQGSRSRREVVNLPNLLTVSRIGLTPVFLVLLFAETWYWRSLAFVVFGAASLTDFYDGRLARRRDKVTALGRFLDPLADKILVTSALLALALGHVVNLWLVLPVVARDIAITVMRVHSLSRGRQLITSRLAKWKTAVQLFSVVIILFVVGLQELLGRFDGEAVSSMAESWMPLLSNGLMAAVLLLTLVSGLHYIFRASFLYNKP